MGRISFQKRQKERKRQEKRQMKAEKRAQRKLAKSEEAVAQSTAPLGTEVMEQEPGTPEPEPEVVPKGSESRCDL
jgi:hypothetical protein